jgi:Fe-S-cluster containining protein
VSGAASPYRERAVDLVRLDDVLLDRVDAEIRAGEDRARGHLSCRRGCTACCIGPFEITGLDAERLRRGYRELERIDPKAARDLRDRARSQWRSMGDTFPGAKETGDLDEDQDALERFCTEFETLPCPVLDPESGACLLYPYRPISCRTYGLPIRNGSEILPPCRLNFEGATLDEISAATIEPIRTTWRERPWSGSVPVIPSSRPRSRTSDSDVR